MLSFLSPSKGSIEETDLNVVTSFVATPAMLQKACQLCLFAFMQQ
jgi:hypothetical protein